MITTVHPPNDRRMFTFYQTNSFEQIVTWVRISLAHKRSLSTLNIGLVTAITIKKSDIQHHVEKHEKKPTPVLIFVKDHIV
mgnify:CR=1 FL=1